MWERGGIFVSYLKELICRSWLGVEVRWFWRGDEETQQETGEQQRKGERGRERAKECAVSGRYRKSDWSAGTGVVYPNKTGSERERKNGWSNVYKLQLAPLPPHQCSRAAGPGNAANEWRKAVPSSLSLSNESILEHGWNNVRRQRDSMVIKLTDSINKIKCSVAEYQDQVP